VETLNRLPLVAVLAKLLTSVVTIVVPMVWGWESDW